MTPALDASVNVTLLGGLAVRSRGVTVAAPATRALELLAYLTVHADSRHPRSQLATLLWPDSPEPQARTNLRRELHHLRALVPSACLDVTAATIGWTDHPACTVDVRTFLVESDAARKDWESARSDTAVAHGLAAVRSFTGALLPGSYADWVLESREALAYAFLALCDRLTQDLGRTDLVSAKEVARQRVQVAPWEEVGYRTLMSLEAASGDRAGALTTYHRCASVLEEQLGLTPSPDTVALMRSLLDTPADLTRPSRRTTGVRERARRTEVMGREAEMNELLGAWRRTREHSAQLVMIQGDPGVGKTTLLRELGRIVSADGAAVATGRCFGTSSAALTPVAAWLRDDLFANAITALPTHWRDEVRRLVPDHQAAVLTAPEIPTPNRPGGPDTWQRHRFFEGLTRAMTSLDRPLLLLLDDLHWADSESTAWIAFMLRFARDCPILVVASARHDELQQRREVTGQLSALRSAGLVHDVRLAPLGRGDTAALAGAVFGRPLEDEESRLLHAVSGGYPLYVVEASRTSLNRAAPRVSEQDLAWVLQQRLSEASEPAQDCAALAAALGRDFRLELLVEASDLDEPTVVAGIDELWHRRILRQVGHGYDFTHDLLREAAYQSVPPARRWLEHRRLAQALELLRSGTSDAMTAALAEQYDRGGRPERAIPYLVEAAREAEDLFATTDAIGLLRRALELVRELPASLDRDHRELEVLRLMSAPLNAVKGYADPELEAVLRRSRALATSLGQPASALVATIGLWASTFVQGDIVGSYDLACQARDLLSDVPDLAGQVHFGLGGSTLSLGRPDEAVHHLDLAHDLSLGAVSLAVGTRPEVHARAWSAHGWWLLGDEARWRAAAIESVDRAREIDHIYSLVVSLAYAAVTWQICGDLDRLERTLADLKALCQRYGFAYYSDWALVIGGWLLGGETGTEEIRAGLANLAASRSRSRLPYWLSLLADTQVSQGREADARATLDAARVGAVQRHDRWWLPEVLRARALVEPGSPSVSMLREAEAMAVSQSSPNLVARIRTDLRTLKATAETAAADQD